VLLRFLQIVNHAFALQMTSQSLPAASFLLWRVVRFRPSSRIAIQVVILPAGSGFVFRTPCLPRRLEQRQLLFR
jgi:hypothetical protein